MADVFEPEVRSYVMSRVKSRDTKPEIAVRKFLHAHGFRFNLHGKFRGTTLPGKPDVVLPKYKTAVFIHGCFWHAHPGCPNFSFPQTRREWWKEKLLRNRARDEENRKKLESMGWKVHVIWSCRMTKIADLEAVGVELLHLLGAETCEVTLGR